MASRLEPVRQEVKLDFTQTKRELDELEKRIAQSGRKADVVDKVVRQKVGPSGGRGRGEEPGKSITDRLMDEVDKRMGGGTGVSGGKRSGVSRAAGAAVVGGVSRFASPAAAAAIRSVAVPAAGYAAVSGGAQFSPAAIEFLREALGMPEGMGPVMEAVEGLRNAFATFESGVTGTVAGIKEAIGMSAVGARLTGTAPSPGLWADESATSHQMERMLEKKFNDFKRREVAGGMGRALREGVADITR